MIKNGNNSGLFWHVHDDVLLEFCGGYREHCSYVKEYFPHLEVEETLRLCKQVKGKLPKEIEELLVIWHNESKKWEGCWAIPSGKIGIFNEDREIWNKMYKVQRKINMRLHRVVQKNMSAITKLHIKECPNCTNPDGEWLLDRILSKM